MASDTYSVGKALTEGQVYSVDHPSYKHFAAAVEQHLTEISERETSRRAAASPVVFTSYLTPDELNCLGHFYPEFSVKVVPINSVVHAYWNANRKCANEWLMATNFQYASRVISYGGSLLASVMMRRRGLHLEYDSTNAVSSNETYQDAVDLHRLYGDFVQAQKEYGIVLPRDEYSAYLKKEAYAICKEPHQCTHKADALSVDLSMANLTPEQVALAMVQHGATLAHGFFIYTPNMLVQKEGELGVTGVRYKKTGDHIDFLYPEGASGVLMYSLDSWSRWLASHYFKVNGSGQDRWFQLELLKQRDCYMFFRMISVDAPQRDVQITHALDLPDQEAHVLIKSWRLKNGFRADISRADAWEETSFIARERVVRRATQHAMQLNPQQFSRFAIKKQIRIVNNRWVLEGSSVSVAPVLDPQQIEDLTTAIYARTFVDRYESAQLSKQMMDAIGKLVGFSSMSSWARVAVVAKSVVASVYSVTIGKAVPKARNFLDWMRSLCGNKFVKRDVAELLPVPAYVKLSTFSGGWRSVFVKSGQRLYKERNGFFDDNLVVSQSSIAGSLAATLSRFPRKMGLSRDEAQLENVVRVCTDVTDTRVVEQSDVNVDELLDAVQLVNNMDSTASERYNVEFETAIREAKDTVSAFLIAEDPDPVSSLNELYAESFPAVARQELAYDTYSLSLDPQDRTLAAPYLKMPTYFGLPPVPRNYFRSRLKALNVPKRQNTAQELLSAIGARNLSAPAISRPQQEHIIPEIWDNFLDVACVPEARQKIAEFQLDPVGLANESLVDWASKAKPGVVEAVKKQLSDSSKSLEQMGINDYLAMLKADVKPTLSDKPLTEATAPQVIVYHEKPLSALYSSIFRVLVRRFLSLLKPNYHVNLLKDAKDISQFLTAVHPYGRKVRYLENDFSKFDKSQSEFAFDLEHYVFQQLGMNQQVLDQWFQGHVECNIRAVTVGLSLHVMYQRKSGDATTAFGNAILNTLSVSYAYRGTQVIWALFMGDDSLVCASEINEKDAITILAEIFNLTAKFFVTDAPYFASNFICVDEERMEVDLLPDPIKRVERMSMHISAEDPQWVERYESFADAMMVYAKPNSALAIARSVPLRYNVSEGAVRGAAEALGTLAYSVKNFRSVWEDEPEIVSA